MGTISYSLLIFIIYSILGWVLDELIHYVLDRKGKRGVLYGLWSPVFGHGMGILLKISSNFNLQPPIMLLVCMATAFALCFLMDSLLEKLFGIQLSPRSGNVKIQIKWGMLYGILGFAAVYFMHPFVLNFVQSVPSSLLAFFTNAMTALLLLDILFSLNGLSNLYKVLEKIRSRQEMGLETNLGFLTHFKYKLHLLDAYTGISFRGYGEALDYLNTHRPVPKAKDGYFTRIKKTTAAAGKGTIKNFKEYFNYHHLFWVFIIAGVLGYIVEMIFCVVTRRVVESRQGLLYGPFSQVYGLAAVVMVLTLKPLQYKNDRWLFVGSAVIGGVFEVLCSVVQEAVFGSVSWDYSGRSLGVFGGRTSLVYMLFWGILGTVFIKEIHPRFTKIINYIPKKQGITLTGIISVLIFSDMALSSLAVQRWYERSQDLEAKNRLEEFLDEQYPDDYLKQIYPNLQMLE